jgi:tRNA1(Val) A37 N6-methylase TrmN6
VNDGCADGTLLGGKILYRQKKTGYRTGIEPILLAACIPARAGEHVIEAGAGAGAGLLALNARVPGLVGLGLERDPEIAAIAAANLTLNRATNLTIRQQALEDWKPERHYDHAFANPPWHRDDATPSPDPGRRDAKGADDNLLSVWVRALAAPLRRRGTLTLVLPAASLSQAASALAACHCRELTLLPLWPHAGESAKLMILQAFREGRGASRILPGLVLHEPDGAYTRQTASILRDTAPLVL